MPLLPLGKLQLSAGTSLFRDFCKVTTTAPLGVSARSIAGLVSLGGSLAKAIKLQSYSFLLE
ncbi:hypothetical protein H6G04_19005 [Calothrix membranacea FACHB-236]|nr:hypothetical protein [Calothrix membranacea FACHB-236]